MSQSSIRIQTGCLYIPDRQMVASRVLWSRHKQSGMSPSFSALLSVALCCPDYCLLLLLLDNIITIPFVWGQSSAECSAARMEKKTMYEKYLFYFGFFSALSNNNKTNFNPSFVCFIQEQS